MRNLKGRATVKQAKRRGGANPEKDTFHLLLRVRSENGQTITAHKDMVAKRGSALLGKMGDAIGPRLKDRLNQQIERGVKTYLFLTTREGWNGPYVTDRCLLRRVHDYLDTGKQALVPRYYAPEIPRIKTWFEIGSLERLTREEMNRIFVHSSGREIMSVIASSATVFGVGVNAKTR